jgi:hypothetical protein
MIKAVGYTIQNLMCRHIYIATYAVLKSLIEAAISTVCDWGGQATFVKMGYRTCTFRMYLKQIFSMPQALLCIKIYV